MSWNPETQDYCRNCNCYQSIGTYIYELERSPAKRKCKHLARVSGLPTSLEILLLVNK